MMRTILAQSGQVIPRMLVFHSYKNVKEGLVKTFGRENSNTTVN